VFLGRVLCLLVLSSAAIAQSPEALKYAPRQMLLVDPTPGTEAVLPMVFITDGQQRLEFVPTSRVKDSMAKGGQPIRLGDLLSVLSGATDTINKLQAENARLQAENDKLWKLAMKDAPKQEPPTVIVQQPAPQQPSPLERYMLLRSLLPPTQPYRLPQPVNPNANQLHCTSTTMGTTTNTDCH